MAVCTAHFAFVLIYVPRLNSILTEKASKEHNVGDTLWPVPRRTLGTSFVELAKIQVMLFMALLASLLGIGALKSTLSALRSFITIVRPL